MTVDLSQADQNKTDNEMKICSQVQSGSCSVLTKISALSFFLYSQFDVM